MRCLVEVKKVPQNITRKEEVIFLHEIENGMHMDRPRVVLDCSEVVRADHTVIHLLLCCLEAALKRNGDVRLADVTPGVAAVLEARGICRLFDIYRTTNEAVESFHEHSVEAIIARLVPSRDLRLIETESAA